jgi:UDP-2,4-diacetamido-2,4,6-trideoxy-beta-L-altropyranose hydrolase
MEKAPTAHFLCRVGSNVGYGHLMRSLALYERLVKDGWNCQFICDAASLAQPIMKMQSINAITRANFKHQQFTKMALGKYKKSDWLIVDDYAESNATTMDIRGHFKKVAIFKDLKSQSLCADLIIGYDDEHLNALEGPKYIPIRAQVVSIRDRFTKKWPTEFKRVSIFFGGVDSKGLTLEFTRHLLSQDNQWRVDVFIGSLSKQIKELKQLSKLHNSMSLHIDNPNPTKLMARSSFSIGAGGLNAWERCVIGLPSVIISTNSNQDAYVRKIVEAGAAKILDYAELSPSLIDGAMEMMKDKPTRDKMSECAFNLCDGLGANRVSAKLLSFTRDRPNVKK